MCDDHKTISLGFTEQQFPPGIHVCQIFSDDDERQESVLKFLLSGLLEGERTSCFSEKVTAKILQEFLDSSGVSYDETVKSGACTLSGTHDVYLQGGRFDPKRSLNLLKQYYIDSIDQGYEAARVIGEMPLEVQHTQGGEGLMEYESRVSLLLQEYPLTTVCQYSAHDFNGALIMDVLKVHPYIVVKGSVIHNPFHIPPEEFLT